MIRNLLSSKKIQIFLIVFLGLLAGIGNKGFGQAVGDYGSAASGNWGTTGTWVVCKTAVTWTGATAAPRVPTSANNVWIRAGHTITMNGNSGACKNLTVIGIANWTRGRTTNVAGNLTINGGTLSGSSTGTLNVAGTFTVPSSATASIQRVTLNITSTTTISGAVNFAINANGTKTFTGAVTIDPGGTWNNPINEGFTFRGGFTNNGILSAGTGIYLFSTSNQAIGGTGIISIPNITVTGVTLTNNNTLSVTTALTGSGNLTQAANATLNIGGTSSITTLTASASGNTVNYNRAGTQTVKATTYYNLLISGSTTKTTGGIVSVGGNLNIGNGTTFTASGFALTVTGTTTVGGGASGTLNISSATGAKAFTGLVTINAGATWNNTAANCPVAFKGGITNSGTFNAGSGIHTFDTNSQALTGTFSIPNVTVTTITLTNNNTLTVGTALTGTGTLTQGTNSILNIGGTAGISNLTATASGNTVNYIGAVQTAKVTTYNNLTLSGSGIKTFATTPTVNAVLSLEGTASVVVTTGVVTYGASATLQYNKPAGYTVTSEEWPATFMSSVYPSGGIVIANAGQ